MKRIRLTFCLALSLLFVHSAAGQDDRPVEPLSRQDSLTAMMLTSQAVRAAIDKVRPSLVTIESFGGVSAVQGRIGGIRKQGEGNTTGILMSREGHILTSTFNFIQQPPVITVTTSDGKRHVAKLLGRDDTRKVCMLKIEDPGDVQLPEIISMNQVQIGQWVVSIGVGYGDVNPAASIGIVSATNRIGGRALQTDANISPANYGGPLVDIQGRVIGICVPMNPQSQAIGAGVEWYDSGIGFAIPLDGADELIGQLKQGKRIYPAFLGILAMPNPQGKGVWIERVVQKSPADEAGILREDVIIAINDQPVRDMMGLKQLLSRFQAGDRISLTLVPHQTEQEKQVQIVLDRPPAPKGDLENLEPPKIR